MKTGQILLKRGKTLKPLYVETMRYQTVSQPVRVRVPDAPIGSHVCLEAPTNIKRLVIEPTISSVQEGQVTVALMVNSTESPIKLIHGLKLRDCLSYDRKVVTNPLQFPTAWVAQTRSTFDTDKGKGPIFIYFCLAELSRL